MTCSLRCVISCFSSRIEWRKGGSLEVVWLMIWLIPMMGSVKVCFKHHGYLPLVQVLELNGEEGSLKVPRWMEFGGECLMVCRGLLVSWAVWICGLCFLMYYGSAGGRVVSFLNSRVVGWQVNLACFTSSFYGNSFYFVGNLIIWCLEDQSCTRHSRCFHDFKYYLCSSWEIGPNLSAFNMSFVLKDNAWGRTYFSFSVV